MYATTLLTLSAILATAFAAPSGNSGSTCSTGPIQCCDSVQDASDPATSALLSLLGVVVQGVDVLVGVQCSPITVIGGAVGSSCSANTVCCENNSVGSAVSIGCVPVSL